MRSLIVITILCLLNSGLRMLVRRRLQDRHHVFAGACIRDLNSDHDTHDNVPVKRATKGKTCDYDGDCDPGSRCIKGSGPEGVCLGH